MIDGCKECGKELTDSCWFCSLECEQKFRDNNQELYVRKIDGTMDWVCPVVDFEETDDELICSNYSYEYRFIKKDVARWEIDRCSCLQDFMDIDRNI
jgi:hypothetical protein